MKKRIAALMTLFAFSFTTANASILGSVLRDSSQLKMGHGLTLYSNTFLSDQKSVGNQTEYYAEYTPNDSAVPVVVTGASVYGKRNSMEIMEYMKSEGMIPMLGINASFFSFATGLPMGHVITDGYVTSKDDRTLAGVGFNADGTAFIENMCIETAAYFGEDYVLQIPHINKLIAKETQMTTLYTPDYGDTTKTTAETINAVLENVSDGVKIGGEITCTVADVFTSTEPVKIEDNQLVISVNTQGNQWAVTLIKAMQTGEEIVIKTTANSEKWNNAKHGLASEGKRLLINGQVVQGLEAGAAPRTAVGIKADGNVIFYVIDGRQTGYSYGARQDTVAKRLKELGCIEALNLDGGGSTTVSGIYPGCDENAIINSPSEGSLRKVTNFIFIKNSSSATGEPAYAYIYPYTGKILSGSSVQLKTKVTDKNFYSVESGTAEYASNEYGSVTQDGVLTVLGEGTVTASVKAMGVQGSASFKSCISPDNIKLYNADNNAELTVIDALAGDSFRLKADAYHDGIKMISSNDAYRWSVSGDGASVTADGILTVSKTADESVMLTVKAGSYSESFEVRIPDLYNPDFYPSSSIIVEDNILNISVSSKSSEIDMEKSHFKVDGRKISFSDCEIIETDKNNVSIKYNISENFRRIYCEAVLADGCTSIAAYENESSKEMNVFDDTKNHWARDIIAYMNVQGIVNGSTENGRLLYRPDSKVTRAEFAVMVSNLAGYNADDYELVSLEAFEDRDKIPTWAENQIKAVYENGLVNGKENNAKLYFEPNAYITRAEAVTIISRILPEQLGAKTLSYKDASSVPSWAKKGFKVLSTSGLINGYEDNTVKPLNNVTRAEAVKLLYNIY